MLDRRWNRAGVCAAALGSWCGLCAGQVLFEAANASAPAGSGEAGGDAQEVAPVQAPPSLESVSLLAVDPPEPPTFLPNDLITIIISERSRSEREQTFEGEKRYRVEGEVDAWVDMLELLELRLQSTDRSNQGGIADMALEFRKRYEADAAYERDDTVTARVTARVVEAKPNGTLLLEARTVIKTDSEEQTIVLGGICRVEDVTFANTVMSNQMFDLRLDIQNTGDVRKDGQKGVIPRVIDTIFNF